jgi:hypothetical protein
MGGNAASSVSSYQAQVARINADVARLNRDSTLTAGADKALAVGTAGAQRMGQIRVAQSASNLDITKGSAARVQDSQQAAISGDVRRVYDNTARAAYGYEVEAYNKDTSARMLEAKAAGEKRAGMMKALGTILGTASSVSGRWMDAKKSGMFGSEDEGPWVGSATSWSSADA